MTNIKITTIYNQDQWHGIIQGDKKRFKIIAILASNP